MSEGFLHSNPPEDATLMTDYKADNLCAILDNNGLQIDGPTDEIMCSRPLMEKWNAFGWNVLCIDGHDFSRIIAAFDTAGQTKEKPTMIIKGCFIAC